MFPRSYTSWRLARHPCQIHRTGSSVDRSKSAGAHARLRRCRSGSCRRSRESATEPAAVGANSRTLWRTSSSTVERVMLCDPSREHVEDRARLLLSKRESLPGRELELRGAMFDAIHLLNQLQQN